MKRIVLSALMAVIICQVSAQNRLPYKDAKLSTEERVADLMSRMTVKEKIGQLRCILAWNCWEKKGKEIVPSESFKKEIAEGQIGMLWGTYRADPWTQKSLENGLTPELAAKAGNALQRYVAENTRLGIPLFLAEEAPHGHMAIGTTVFPTGLGMAATWNPSLIEQVGRVIAKEIRLQGGHISYGPVIDLARDARWSRVEETMGEDPILTAEIGAAQVRGLGGGDLSQSYSTLATLKHFIAYGTTEGGQNGNPTFLGERELWENFLPTFKRVIDAGALSVMTSYNSLDGIPSTCNDYLLTDVLHNMWNFRGFVVSDLYSINGMWHTHHVANTLDEAGIMALKAGVDADLGALAYENLEEGLNNGSISIDDIDRACRRILRMKFEMGLFENPYVDPKKSKKGVRTEEHKQTALDVARQSVTLLKNENNTLPLSKTVKVAVVGPNADNIYNQLGDYTSPQDEGNVKTILDGIRQKIGAENVVYAKGCAVRDTTENNIQEAVSAALQSDVVVACVGGSSARDFKTSYKDTGAAITDSKTVSDMDCGEGFDRATLGLLGMQQELLEALRKTGKPLVVVYIEGRPMDKLWSDENADALITAYYPGQEGGTAITDVIFGDYNPAGRLPVSVAANVGQLPVYYNKKAPLVHDYVEMSAKPLYAFGYGLSYTDFEYSNLKVSKHADGYLVSCDVKNVGSRDGDEVVQLYLHDEVASTVQPLKQLKHFERRMIKSGDVEHFQFVLTANDLSIIDRKMQRVLEPGDFKVMIGSSSDDIRLEQIFRVE